MDEQRPRLELEEKPIEGGEIEGGKIEGLDPTGSAPFQEKKHRADTERRLAYWLVGCLVGTWLLHYGVILTLEWKGKHEAAENLSKAFNVWLPVISSLASSVVTYYFTRERR
ncbi:MAG: hypothetical protein AB7P14_09130 [Blastocatellales bacterium]